LTSFPASAGGALRPDGEIVDRSGQVDFPVEAGDVVGVDTPGGGGFGA
jgi:hypothetical protein